MPRSARWTSDRVTDGHDRHAGHQPRRPRLLLLCDFRPHEAATVIDHIEAIRARSRYDVFIMPIAGDLPDQLDLEAFDGLLIHYNLVMSSATYLSPLARWRIGQYRGVKAAFVQDEYRFVDATIGVMRTLGIHVVFTCVPQDQVELVYAHEALPDLKRTVTVLTGYVPKPLLALPVVPYAERTVDVSYRGRRLPAWLGRLGQEKGVIADRFRADAAAHGLSIDISTREHDRLYGRDWIDFISRSRAMLGVESGASIFDFDGSIEQTVREYLSTHPDAPFDELQRLFLAPFEGRIRLNQISPRCFEAAALGTLMVLYPGDYSGILKPWRHYVPLLKDHSNMAEVAHAVHDRPTWERITAQARQEVALNRRYSFEAMVETVDEALDLTITAKRALEPGAFARMADGSYARLRTTQLHALGLPPAVNRARLMAGRALRAFGPSPIAIAASPTRPRDRVQVWRRRWQHVRSMAYWAVRPHDLPWALLARHRGALLTELSELGRLQRLGARALAVGAPSPFVLLVDEATRDLCVVLRRDAPASGSPLPAVPADLSSAFSVSLHLTDAWLIPPGIDGLPGRWLDAVSALLRARPDVGRRLLAGRAPWCDVLLLRESAGDRPLDVPAASPESAPSPPGRLQQPDAKETGPGDALGPWASPCLGPREEVGGAAPGRDRPHRHRHLRAAEGRGDRSGGKERGDERLVGVQPRRDHIAVGPLGHLRPSFSALNLFKGLAEVAEVRTQWNVVRPGLKDPVVRPFDEDLWRPRRARLQVARRDGAQVERPVQVGEA